ncbi:SufB/SufD family protein [Picrophilus oshimae]|uniref:Fe-S cluster assembly protein SufD n=1 Tax=Picrophilus torridus (strain ATCC 700027 / DSM 9790 / JCM 10055 / NBRC 100828 / KAW 2/3) TaxID=1122961 RepID=A0A8G2FXH2_PICTO|nr:SufD family Fe-S cluster assembly protein [Picrophilus oshimae]SMD31322.1 Fe-S cluster assembly protein SufD [Picrophilus oshimae DSM 9789]
MITEYLEILNRKFRDFDSEYRKQAYIYYLKTPRPDYKESPTRKTYVDVPDDSIENMVYGNIEGYDFEYKSDADIFIKDLEIKRKTDNVLISDMKTAFKTNELYKKYLSDKYGNARLEYLINAAWLNGYFIYVPENSSISISIESLNPSSSFTAKNVIIAGKNSSVEITDIYRSYGSEMATHGRNVYIIAEENASVKYNYIQDESNKINVVSFIRSYEMPYSSVSVYNVNTGGSKVIYFSEPVMYDNTYYKSYGVNISKWDQALDVQDNSLQIGKNTAADISTRGVILNNGTILHHGNIDIEEKSFKSTGFYDSSIILMSEKGYANSKPALLIKNNDTRSKHGSYISTIDEEKITYIRSRGISYSDARRLFINGFLSYIEEKGCSKKTAEFLDEFINRLSF